MDVHIGGGVVHEVDMNMSGLNKAVSSFSKILSSTVTNYFTLLLQHCPS